MALIVCSSLRVTGVNAQTDKAAATAITPTTGIVSIESDLQRADNITGVITATGNCASSIPIAGW